jgi:CxxC motif-containing protein (DUF1111 family)
MRWKFLTLVSAAGGDADSYVKRRAWLWSLYASACAVLLALAATSAAAQKTAHDPGPREGVSAGSPVAGLTPAQQAFFSAGLVAFRQIASVTGSLPGTRKGLGPGFNALSCAQCHSQPAIGGSSPAVNPQIGAAIAKGATNQIPTFVTARGPVRVARFPYAEDMVHSDGSSYALFTIAGRNDAAGCKLAQPNFQQAADKNNLIFRIPSPAFGGGFIESIPDTTIMANMNSDLATKRGLGIAGHPNLSPNDASITRFGWKAQNKSLEMAAAEADNLEIGVSNELFPNELVRTPGCQINPTPEDATTFSADGTPIVSDVIRFAGFVRLLDQSKPAPSTLSTVHGRQIFAQIGCALCHTPALMTGPANVAALSNLQAKLFSDLLLHHMGPKLADNISQGAAQGDEFRTAPLWGVGQRLFFLHDGRTADLLDAIENHSSRKDDRYPDSEANAVIGDFKKLAEPDKQDLLNFLRSL